MKKYICIFAAIIGINFSFSQFVLKGTIENYPNKNLLIYKKGATDRIYIETVSTDNSGTFSYKIPYEFHGLLSIMFAKEKVYHDFFSDNKDITFSGFLQGENFKQTSIKSEINQAYSSIEQNEMMNYKLLYLTELNKLYTEKEGFKSTIDTEINRLKSLQQPIDVEKFPLISYVMDIKNLTEQQASTEEEISENLSQIRNHLLNDGVELEQSGLIKSLILPYINLSLSGATDKNDQLTKIKSSVETLLKDADIETTRGQNILLAINDFFESYEELKPITNAYITELSKAKCSITPELKDKMTYKNNLQVGKPFPVISFSKNASNKKYKKLTDIKSDYKLVIVWASWCPHCQKEKAEVQNFYAQFKNDKKGEIISFGLESSLEDYQEFNKDITWTYDSDIKYWSTPHAEMLGVTSTPTFFILDKNNNLLAIKNNIQEVKDYFK